MVSQRGGLASSLLLFWKCVVGPCVQQDAGCDGLWRDPASLF